MDLKRLAGELQKRGLIAVELLKEAAYEVSWDARDFAKSGFGVPKLITSTASLGVATVAAVGSASVAFDLVGKFWGKKDCDTCNGWEGLRCNLCNGLGTLQYKINESSLSEDDRRSVETIAAAALDGRAAIEYFPAAVTLKMPLPTTTCRQCDGTGVMKCRSCDGDAWVPQFTLARTMDPPKLALDVFKKIRSPIQEGNEYDAFRQKVAKREPGWETLQEMLILNDPERAVEDPVIITDRSYLSANLKIVRQVGELPVPPRPADWKADDVHLNIKKPFNEPFWSKEDLEDGRKSWQVNSLPQEQENQNVFLDNAWAAHWREQKIEEVKREMIKSYEREKEVSQQPAEPESKQSDTPVGLRETSVSKSKQTRPGVEKKADGKKRPDDDKKKRERQERSERMSRQAAEREAALAKAKAAREQKSGS